MYANYIFYKEKKINNAGQRDKIAMFTSSLCEYNCFFLSHISPHFKFFFIKINELIDSIKRNKDKMSHNCTLMSKMSFRGIK